MTRATLAQHNVVAAFRDMELASDAIGRLRQAGFPDQDISILGRPADEVDVPSEHEVGEPLPGGEGVITHVFAGGAGGGAIGAVLGAAGGAAVAAIPGVGLAVGVGALLGAIGAGGAGATVGSILEGESALRSDASWGQTFQAIKEGATVVGVHTDDLGRVEEAERLLAELDPMQVVRVNEQGHEIRPSADES